MLLCYEVKARPVNGLSFLYSMSVPIENVHCLADFLTVQRKSARLTSHAVAAVVAKWVFYVHGHSNPGYNRR